MRKPLVSRSRSSIYIVMCTFALLQKLCLGLKRARREKWREIKYREAQAETGIAAAALRNFHFARIVSAQAEQKLSGGRVSEYQWWLVHTFQLPVDR